MRRPALLTGATLPTGLGSLLAMAGQAALALLLLRLYSPQAVGEFSVLSQVAYAWGTLALAQSSIGLLVNPSPARRTLVQGTLVSSARRWAMLAPVALLACLWLYTSDVVLHEPGFLPWLLVATALMSLLQAGWLLAQSVQLRWGAPRDIVLVRMGPPVAAAVLVACAATLGYTTSLALLVLSCAAFAAGCVGLRTGLANADDLVKAPAARQQVPDLADGRSLGLRMGHTFTDLLVSTVLALYWAVLYGTAAAGFLLLSLRVLGFVPVLVSAAWSQGVLTRPAAVRPPVLWVLSLASAAVMALAGLAWVAASSGWLTPEWRGLEHYILPVALWQWGAVLVAAVSYRPFLAGPAAASRFSRVCIGCNIVQLAALVLPPALGVDPSMHLWFFAVLVTMLQGATAAWAACLDLGP